jgi:integrase
MPRPSKGPRLYLRKRKGQAPVYVIRDGQAEISTGCTGENVEQASEALREYLASRFRPETGQRNLNKIYVSEVLMLYLTDLPADSPSRETIRYHVKALSGFWGDKSLADVKGSTCRAYLDQRTGQNTTHSPLSNSWPSTSTRSVKPTTARQELKTLQSSIHHWHRESPLSAVPKVTLPKPGSRRERVLERSEVARMLWACRKLSREGRKAARGAVQFTDYSHVARFILIGVYTGTRHDAVLKLRWAASDSGGHIDLQRGVIFRRGASENETSKRRPPVSLPRGLHSRVARWHDLEKEDVSHVIHHKGQPVLRMKRAWNTVRKAAGLGEDVTPHTLRHTCASWLLWGREARGARPAQKPLTIWEVAGVIGADASTIERVYGHHRRPE